MTCRYQRLCTKDSDMDEPTEEAEEWAEEPDQPLVTSYDTASTDIEMDDVTDNSVTDTKMTEQQLLLPSDGELHKAVAKRKAQLLKVTLAAIVCLLQTVALPLFYGEAENYWGEEGPAIMTAAKYSLYGTFILSCLFAPMFIAMFGIKVILVLGSFSVCIFIAANFVPLKYSAIPASVISGLTLGPFFVTQGVFVTNCAYRYCKTLSSCDQDVIINIANGLFYTIMLAAPFISNAMNLLFLQPVSIQSSHLANSTMGCGESSTFLCQSGYQHELFIMPNKEDFEFSYHRIQALLGAHLTISFTGLILCALVFNSNHPIITRLQQSRCSSPHKKNKWTSQTKSSPSCKVALCEHFQQSIGKWDAAFAVLKDVNLLLVLPLFVYLGMQQGLAYNMFIKDVAGCRLDRRHVYLMRMVISASSVVVSLPVAILARYIGRFRLSLPAVATQLSLVLTILLWQPGLDQWRVLYVVAALWGCTDAVWQIMTSALVGRIFRSQKHAAYSHLRFGQMVGILLVDVFRSFLCTPIVLYIFFAIFILSYGSFLAFEIRIGLQLKDKMATGAPYEVTLTVARGTTWVPGLSPHPHVPRKRDSLTK